eukprot:5267167-Pleurochrysis_carterae.AAC.1
MDTLRNYCASKCPSLLRPPAEAVAVAADSDAASRPSAFVSETSRRVCAGASLRKRRLAGGTSAARTVAGSARRKRFITDNSDEESSDEQSAYSADEQQGEAEPSQGAAADATTPPQRFSPRRGIPAERSSARKRAAVVRIS